MPTLAATDYAGHLCLVLDRVRAHQSRLLSPDERELIDLALALPALERQHLAVLAGRKRRVFPRRNLPGPEIDGLVAHGWLQPCAVDEEAEAVAAALTLTEIGAGRNSAEASQALAEDPELAERMETEHGPFHRFSDAARRCLGKCRLLAWGDWREDLSDLVRLGMGQLHAPADTPLAQCLAGHPVHLDRFPIKDQAELDALLASRSLRELEADRELMPQVLALLDQARGQPCPLLGSRFTIVGQLAVWIWRCLEELTLDEAEQTAIMEILAEVPLAPSMSRRLARERWRRAVGRSRQAIAAEIADWQIWAGGEARRWRLRASGKRSGPRADSIWPVRRLEAWLDHGSAGKVVAEGEGVEDHALRRLAAEGWQGLHCEGQLWMALAIVIGWPVLSLPVPGVWYAPLQCLPGDWGGWGFAERRRAELGDLHRRILADPLAALDSGWHALGLGQVNEQDPVLLVGVGALPPFRLLRAVCERLPGRSLAALVGRLLRCPQERSGLPDLLVWRDDELFLWEVKSPGDALGDQQWTWLEWLRLQEVPAGVLRVDARPSEQLSLIEAPKRARAHIRSTASVHRRKTAERRHSRGATGGIQALLLNDGRLLAMGLRRRLPDGRTELPEDPCWPLEQVSEVDTGPDPANRPRLRCLPLRGFCWQEGRQRRWQLLPGGLQLGLAERLEADPEGGLVPTAHLLLRPAGWCCAADQQDCEPLLLDRDQVAAYQDLAVGDLLDDLYRPPAIDPCRVDDCAAAWQLRDNLAQQLSLVTHEPHAVEADPIRRHLRIHLKPESAVLWLGLPGIERVDADFL